MGMILENKFLYFLRKERGVPSTWGENACFLDLLEKEDHHVGHTYQTHVGWNSDKQLYLDAHFKNIGAQQSPDFHTVANYLCHHFSREEEYGLLNRLDTETSGFLYFAKNHEFYEAYRGQQKAGKIVKHYLAEVHGNPGYLIQHGSDDHGIYIDQQTLTISYPLQHHRHVDDRMVVVKDKYLLPTSSTKGRGSFQEAQTSCRIVSYNQELDITLLHVNLLRGARHQIRAHLSAIGYPILGDPIYAKKTTYPHLHLRSIGCEVDAES